MSDLALLVLLKAAYLVTGLILCLVGKRLIDRKLKTRFEGEGAVAKSSFKLVTTSPGIVFLAAGFAVIAAAIVQKTKITETYRNAPSGDEPLAPPRAGSTTPEPLTALVEKARTISFAGETDQFRTVKDDLARARSLALEGKLDEAAVHLSIAVVVYPPAIMRIASDPAYAAVMRQPQFDTIVRARFQLPIQPYGTPASTLSPAAQEVLARVRSLAERAKPDEKLAREARELARQLPDHSGAEPARDTVARLAVVLQKSPHVLLEQLGRPAQAWVLSDAEIVNALEVEIDRKIRSE